MKATLLTFLLIAISCNYYLFSDELYTWGRNNYQQLGTIDTNFKNSPTKISLIQDWVQISAGFHHTVAIRNDGTLWTWGRNDLGQLGDSTLINRNDIRQIGRDNDWSNINAFRGSTIALKKDGSLWGWGWNIHGELGDGTLDNKLIPTRIGSDNDWSKIVANYDHVLALKKNGTLWAWGKNDKGQLGDGTLIDKASPIQIGSDNDWNDCCAGQYVSIAIKNDGSLWAWGDNNLCFYGEYNIDNKSMPFNVDSINVWNKIFSGGNGVFAIKDDSTLWAWGVNDIGQLGVNNESYSYTISRQQVGSDRDWKFFSMSSRHTLAIKNDGTLWSCGWNKYGQLGIGIDGDVNYRKKFTQIGTANNWSQISSGLEFSVALFNNGKTLATVIVNQITEMTPQLVTIESSILSEGNELVSEKGICWSTSPNPTIDDNKTVDGNGHGIFSSNIVNFQQDTKYYVRAYAINPQGIAYSQQIYFTNSSTLPNLVTKNVNDIYVKSAKSGGFIFNGGNKNVLRRGVCWSTNPEPTISDDKSVDGEGNGEFVSNIIDLKHYTIYYTRAYAENENGVSYGLSKEFKTKLEPPTLIYPANIDTGIVYQPTFLWSNPERVKKFRLQIAVDSLFNLNPKYYSTIFNGIVDTNFFKKDIYSSRYQTIYWRVCSIFGNDTSEWSEVFKFKPAVPNSVLELNNNISSEIIKSIYYSNINSNLYIKYSLPNDCIFSMSIIDLNGQIVAEIEKTERKYVGDYEKYISINHLNSGLYFLLIKMDSYIETRKIIFTN